MRKILPFTMQALEITYIAVSMATLPIWFPLLVIWIVVDLPYRNALWKASNQAGYPDSSR